MTTTKALQVFQVMRQGSLILMSVILAKSQLSTAEIGAYETLLYVGTVLTFFWINGLLQAMTPSYSRMGIDDRKAFVFNNFLVFSGISALLFGILMLGKTFVVPLLTGLPDVPHFSIFCLFLLFNIPSFPVEYLYLLQNKPRHIVVWGILSFGLYIVAVALPLWLGMGLRESMIGLGLLGLGKYLWTLFLVYRYGTWQVRPDIIRPYLRFAAPLMLSVLAGNLILLFDNWLVGWWFKDEAVFAVFRFGAREFPLASALSTALGVSLIPVLTKDLPDGLSKQKDMSRKLFHLLFPLSIVLMFLSKPFFPVVFNPNFAASAGIFNIYLLMVASRVLLPNSIVLSLGNPDVIFRIGLVELVVKIVLGFIFVYFWGLEGVAWSSVLAFWVEKIGLIWYLEKKNGIATGNWLDKKTFLAYCGLLLIAFVLN